MRRRRDRQWPTRPSKKMWSFVLDSITKRRRPVPGASIWGGLDNDDEDSSTAHGSSQGRARGGRTGSARRRLPSSWDEEARSQAATLAGAGTLPHATCWPRLDLVLLPFPLWRNLRNQKTRGRPWPWPSVSRLFLPGPLLPRLLRRPVCQLGKTVIATPSKTSPARPRKSRLGARPSKRAPPPPPLQAHCPLRTNWWATGSRRKGLLPRETSGPWCQERQTRRAARGVLREPQSQQLPRPSPTPS